MEDAAGGNVQKSDWRTNERQQNLRGRSRYFCTLVLCQVLNGVPYVSEGFQIEFLEDAATSHMNIMTKIQSGAEKRNVREKILEMML